MLAVAEVTDGKIERFFIRVVMHGFSISFLFLLPHQSLPATSR